MESVYLRSLEIGDLERTHGWHNDPSLYESLEGVFRYVSKMVEEEWLHKLLAYSTQQIGLAICLSSDAQHIGNIYLREIDWVARRAEVSILIGESGQRSKGYGQASLRLVIGHAFDDLGLARLYAFVLKDNQQSRRMFEKCGFVLEGTLRGHAFKSGSFKDVHVMGLCADIPGTRISIEKP